MSSNSGTFQPPFPPAPTPPPPPRGPMPTPMPYPPQQVIVHVKAKSGGFTRAILFVLGLALFGGAFVVGLITGVGGMLAGAEYRSVVLREAWRAGSDRALAIIPIEGEIDDRQAAFVRAAADEVINSRAFAGVILRVDSPGGGVSASDQIWHDVERLKKAGYPVIASYGGVAASGGYFVSCGADSIMAEQTCITGSIGVIAQVLTFGTALEKLGIQPVTLVASGSPEKNTANDTFRVWNEKDKQSVTLMLDSAYAVFFDRVKTGRGKVITSEGTLHDIANGSVYTAAEALKNGLIDGIGYLDDAVVLAESRCGITTGQARVVRLSLPPSLFGDGLLGLLRQSGSAARSSATLEDGGFSPATLHKALDELATPRVMYRLH